MNDQERADELDRQDLESALRALHVIASSPGTVEEGIDAILEMGRHRFGMSVAVVSRCDVDGAHCEIVTSASATRACQARTESDLRSSLCARVVDSGELLAVGDLSASEWSGHPCHQDGCLASYIGVPVMVAGEIFGTLHFSDATSRDVTLSRVDREILKLMADWVGGQLARQKHQEDLDNRDAGLRGLIAATQDAVVFMDGKGCITDFNPSAERIFGYSADDVLGRDVHVLMPDPYKSEHTAYVERYERTGEKRAIGQIRIVSARRSDGEVFPIELSVTEMRGSGEVRYGAFIRDISEKVRLQERLMDRERLAVIGTTAAMFAHEIGNPLNSMSLQLQLLQRRIARDGEADGAWVAEKAGLVRSELQRLITLLDEFRSMSRRQQYEFKPCDLTALIERVVRAERANFESKGVNVALELDDDAPEMLADEDKLTQVIINLCKNAVEAIDGEQGTLTLKGVVEGDRFLLEVTDTGPGIPTDVDVFQPFVTTKKGGTGLGLPIVRQIVAAHDGSIDYFSRPGECTTFRLRFPLRSEAAESGTRPIR